MAATLATPNYNLPLYAETDSTSWADFNKLSADVDNSLKTVADSGGTTQWQVQELTTKVDTLTQTVNTVDTTVTQQGTEITALKDDAVTTDDAIANLSAKANANETNISNLSTQVTETVLPEVNKNTTDIAEVSTNVSTLQTTVSQQGTRITSLEAKVPNDLQSQLTTLQSNIDTVEGEVAAGFPIKTKAALSLRANFNITTGAIIISCDGAPPAGLYLVSISVNSVQTASSTSSGIGYMWAEDYDCQTGRSKVISSCQIFNAVNNPSKTLRLSFLVQLINATPDMDVAFVRIAGNLNDSNKGLTNMIFNMGDFSSDMVIALN